MLFWIVNACKNSAIFSFLLDIQTLVQIRCDRVEEKKRVEYFYMIIFQFFFQYYKEIATVATNCNINLLLPHKFSMPSVS